MGQKESELLAAWGALFEGHALAIRKVEGALHGRAPLSLDEYDVLLTISRAPQMRIRFLDLANATVFTRSGITRVTKRLEKRGLLARERCAEDKRGVYAVLTQKGKEGLRDTWKLYSVAVIDLLNPCLSQNDARELRRLLEKVVGEIRSGELVSIKARIPLSN